VTTHLNIFINGNQFGTHPIIKHDSITTQNVEHFLTLFN